MAMLKLQRRPSPRSVMNATNMALMLRPIFAVNERHRRVYVLERYRKLDVNQRPHTRLR